MKKYISIKLALIFTFIIAGMQLNAQMIPESYFQPKAGGTPQSDFYAIFSYDLGMVYDEDNENIGESNIGLEGASLRFFFPKSGGKGYTVETNYNKSVQQVYLSEFGFEQFGFDPYRSILAKNFELKAKSISSTQWGFGIVYQRRKYEAGNVEGMTKEEYSFNGIGFELSVGGYPDLNYEKGNWPVSFKTGILLQAESFDKEEPGYSAYGELALERIRKKQGVSLYANINVRFQFDNYYYEPDWAEDIIDFGDIYPLIDFNNYYLIPGFKVGVMF